jgi:hypothetical protein
VPRVPLMAMLAQGAAQALSPAVTADHTPTCGSA